MNTYDYFSHLIKTPPGVWRASKIENEQVQHQGKTYTPYERCTQQTHSWERVYLFIKALFKTLFTLGYSAYASVETRANFFGQRTWSAYVEVPLRGVVALNRCAQPYFSDADYHFAERLRKNDNRPFVPDTEEDFIEVLEIVEGPNELADSKKKGFVIPRSFLQCLCDGEKLRIIYNNRAIEWTCQQARHSMRDYIVQKSFQETFAQNTAIYLKEACEAKRNPRLYDPKIFDAVYRDEKRNGPYRELTNTSLSPAERYTPKATGWEFNLLEHHGVELNEIQAVVDKDNKECWLFIPHQPVNNCYPSELSTYSNGVETFTKETWDPKKGHRRGDYAHGQWTLVWLPRVMTREELILSYSKTTGNLQLTYKEKTT